MDADATHNILCFSMGFFYLGCAEGEDLLLSKCLLLIILKHPKIPEQK
jgi:hypothetical protein